MKGTYRDLMSVDDFFQALFQDRAFFREHGITHIRSAGLYFTPCDESGEAVTIRDRQGRTVEGYETAGCYHCAADADTDAGNLEPRTVSRTTASAGKRSGTKKGGGGKDGGGTRCKP